MSIFSRPSADEQIAAAEAAVTAAEQKIAQLESERAGKLESETYGIEVAAIDQDLVRTRASISVHRQRIEALHVKRRQAIRAELEDQKRAGVAEAAKLLGRRLTAARELDAAIAAVGEAFQKLIKAETATANQWPSTVSHLGLLAAFRLEGIEALSARRMNRPPSVGIVRAVAEHEALNITEQVEIRNRECLDLIESAPIGEQEAA